MIYYYFNYLSLAAINKNKNKNGQEEYRNEQREDCLSKEEETGCTLEENHFSTQVEQELEEALSRTGTLNIISIAAHREPQTGLPFVVI